MMPNKLLILVFITLYSFGQELTYIPDNNFEQKLIYLGYDTELDDYVLTSSIDTISSLIINWDNIHDLTGIQDFTALINLDCAGNNLSELDLSNNIYLEYLDCHQNNLTTLNIINNSLLSYLDTYGNDNLLHLNVSNNNQLKHLMCSYNNLSDLDVSNNTLLTYLNCSYSNNLTELDLSNNTLLTYLNCNGNLISELDIKNNNLLYYLNCSDNNLSELDVSNNTLLEYLYCNWNNLAELDVSSNILLEWLWCKWNEELECVQVWDVDYAINQTYSIMNENYEMVGPYFNSDAIWSLDCEDNKDKNPCIVKSINFLGQDIDSKTNTPFIDIYDNHSVEKKYVIE